MTTTHRTGSPFHPYAGRFDVHDRMPEEGVPFTAIVTISDPDTEQPVFNDMRQNLQALGTQIADIRMAARITPRI